MNIYPSYTYIISWSNHNTHYYGVRWANKCEPNDDLWIHYFTSSQYVKQFRELHGDPDIIKIDKTFDDKDDAINYEVSYLTEHNAVSSEQWLNQCAFPTFDNTGNKRPEHSKRMMGENNPMYGKMPSDETRQKMSENRLGKTASAETKAKMSATRKGVKKSEEHVRKVADANRGQTRSDETKRKLSEAHKNRPPITCPHCNKSGGPGAMKRWHFDKCKFNDLRRST